MSASDVAYAAGFFDGEGSISVSLMKDRYLRIEVACSQKYSPALRWMQRTFGGNVYGEEGRGCQWKLHGEDGTKFLHLVSPFLIVKAREAQLVLHMWNIRSDTEELRRLVDEYRHRRDAPS